MHRRDEILQVMYWLQGEGLSEAVGAADLERFLEPDAAPRLPGDLAGMARAGLLESVGAGRYRLTERGREEGGRRFADAFAGMTGGGHGQCSDPACDCHIEGPEACVHAP